MRDAAFFIEHASLIVAIDEEGTIWHFAVRNFGKGKAYRIEKGILVKDAPLYRFRARGVDGQGHYFEDDISADDVGKILLGWAVSHDV